MSNEAKEKAKIAFMKAKQLLKAKKLNAQKIKQEPIENVAIVKIKEEPIYFQNLAPENKCYYCDKDFELHTEICSSKVQKQSFEPLIDPLLSPESFTSEFMYQDNSIEETNYHLHDHNYVLSSFDDLENAMLSPISNSSSKMNRDKNEDEEKVNENEKRNVIILEKRDFETTVMEGLNKNSGSFNIDNSGSSFIVIPKNARDWNLSRAVRLDHTYMKFT